MSISGKLVQFLRTYRVSETETVSIKFLWRLWSIVYVIVIGYILILTQLFPDIASSFQPVKLQGFVFQQDVRTVILLAVLLGPLMEEFLFRAGMKWGGWNVSWLLGAIIFLVLEYFFAHYLDGLIESQFYKSVIVYATYAACVILSFHCFRPWFPNLSRIYARWPGVVFWLLTVAFALAHIGNFDLDEWNRLMLLMTVPQLFLGIMLGFVRIQWGLGWSILLHMFHNLIQLIPIIILKQLVGPNSDIISAVENLNPTDLTGSSRWMVGGLYAVVLFGFLAYNVIVEIRSFATVKSHNVR